MQPQPEIIRLPVPSGPETPEAYETMTLAHSYCRAILDNCRIPQTGIGTCVLVGIGKRLFVLTAKHCVGPNPFVILTPEAQWPCEPMPYIKIGLSPNRDIGFIEIENNPAYQRLPVECLCPDPPPISADPRKPIGPPTWIIGYPVDRFETVAGNVGMFMRNCGTHILKVTEDAYYYAWPIIEASFNEAKNAVEETPVTWRPHGFSGGGAWELTTPPADGLSLPQNMFKLYGVQSSWVVKYQLLQCIPVRYWLKLVHDQYLDLQELLATQFSFLRT